MTRFILLAVVPVVAGSWLVAAPVPAEAPAKSLVAGLSNPSEKVRNESAAALKNRVDALPWLRRAACSDDKDTARRAAALIAPHEAKRQEVVAKAIDVCVHDGRIDLLTEWHQYWKPREETDLWKVGPRAAKAGMDLFAKSCPKAEQDYCEHMLGRIANVPVKAHNGPCLDLFQPFSGVWTIRTDRMDRMTRAPNYIRFASVGGPVQLNELGRGGRYLILGPVQASRIDIAFVACDGDVRSKATEDGTMLGVTTTRAVVVCRGSYTGDRIVGASVLLVDGDIDLRRMDHLKGCLIRASGEIRISPNVKPENCDIKAHAKNATAPYKFFEVSDVGLSLADDEEGLVVRAVKADTPFGNGSLQKGDLVLAIDDAPAKGSEQVRKLVRRALVRQGDCLITVVRGNKTLDLPVFFPLPK